MKEEKDEDDVVERLAREFLNGVGEEEVKSRESGVGSQELGGRDQEEEIGSQTQLPEESSFEIHSLKEEMALPTFEMPEPEEELFPRAPSPESRAQNLSFKIPPQEEEPYSPSFKMPEPEEESYSPSFEIPGKEPPLPTFEIHEEKPPLPTFEIPLPEKKSSFPIFEEPEKEEVTETPAYSPSYEEEEKEIKSERPSDEKLEEILAKLEEEERGIGLPKQPVKVEQEEEEEEFVEIPEVSDEEIMVKRPKGRKTIPKFIKFVILWCIFGGIIAAAFYFGKSYYKPTTNLINLDIINNTVNKIFKPSCDLIVSSNPMGCDLFVDDIVKGKTPITIKKLISGDHNLRIEKEGFKPFISVISVVSRKPINIMANLEPEIKIEREIPVVIGTSTLIVRTNPKNAAIYIDGQKTKMPYTLLSGTHSIRVLNDGFFKWTKIIELKPEETKEIFVQLTPCLGSILIDSTPRGGYILFNGDIKGKTPIILSGISPWKPFRIIIRRKGYFDWNGTTFVEPNQRTKIMASLKESGVKSQESRVWSQESRVKSQESRVKSREEAKFVPNESFYETRKESGGFVPVLPTRKEDKITESFASILELNRAIDMFKEQVKVEVPVIPPYSEEPFLKRDIPKITKEKPKPYSEIAKGEGSCFITSTPGGAEVFLDGRLIGKTPIREFTISSGKHRIKASLSGYKEEEKEIVVSSKTINFFNFSLSK